MLQHKHLVIIGGTTGIGLAATRAFTEQGAKVIAVGLDEESCAKLADESDEAVKTITADAREEDTAASAIELCLQSWGSFHGLYHVAGGSGRKYGDGPLHEMTLDGWNKTLELNLTSVMLSNRAAVQAFLKHKVAGSILNTGSVLGWSPSPQFFTTHAYAAAKSGIIGFTKAIAAHYAKDNIRANVIAPALTETPMAQRAANNEEIMAFVRKKQPLNSGRIAQPEDLTGLACYCMSDQSRYTTGQVFAVDGGWTVSG